MVIRYDFHLFFLQTIILIRVFFSFFPSKLIFYTSFIFPMKSFVLIIIVWLGAWLLLDAFAYSHRYDKTNSLRFIHLLPYFFSCFFILVANSFTREDFEGYGFSEFNHTRARALFFVGLAGLLISLFAAVWISVDKYLDVKSTSNYAGYALIFTPFINLISAVVVRVAHW